MTETIDVAVLLNRLSRIAHAMQFSHGLNPAQWEALRYIGRANRYSASPTALADYVGSTKGTVSQTLIALEAKGFVSRVREDCDRRKVSLVLTEAGRSLLDEDPLCQLSNAAGAVDDEGRSQIAEGLRAILNDLCIRQGAKSFGVCGNCCHLRKDAKNPCGNGGVCGVTTDSLDVAELDKLCVNFERAELC
ncbi:MAG: MarR family transcriptional regulator [Proteobacteria bacterium]|nr:MarR family transcriptional regulator [Pseudomonadota bacterium]